MSQTFKFKRAERDAEFEQGTIDFETLVGSKYFLYYHNHLNQFQLGRVIFEALEDENDGYRSSLSHVKVISTSAPLRQKLAEIQVQKLKTNDNDLFQLVDTEDSHVWLEFGTNDWDDYYPCFIFNVNPKI